MSRRLMNDDLKRSGISEGIGKKLKMEFLTAIQTKKLGHYEVPSYRIPYFDVRGKPTNYYRVRYLEIPTGEFGRELPKEARYSGPPDHAPEAYFPKIVNWVDPIAKDTTIPIWLTEGEKKATAACIAGVHCIAFGGVAMFQSKKRGITFLPELDEFDWGGREVIIAYDSDKNTNANIIRDQNTLATRLLERNARVLICDIPETAGGKKAGLDDFLMRGKNAKERKTLLAFLAAECTDEYEKSAVLHELQNEVAIIRSRGAVWVFEQRALIADTSRLATLNFGDRMYEEPPTSEGGKPKSVQALTAWLKWGQRRSHRNIVYTPGEPEVVNDDLNIWEGWGVNYPPTKGDVKPFEKLVSFLFQDDPDLKPWFWQWLAYPLQNPGAKMYSAVLLHGPIQGTGKTFLGEIMGDIYGENFSLISQDELTSQFNDDFTRKQFILADEVVSGNDRKAADKIKGFITRQTISINRKYEAQYKLRDTINYYFTSNHFDAAYLERSDRRYAIVRVPDETLELEFYRRLRAWRANGGAEALFRYLLGVDTTGFDSLGPPPETASHREMVETSFSDIDQWCEDLRTSPDRILQLNGIVSDRILFEGSELLTLLDPGQRRGTTSKALAMSMRKAGFRQKTVRSKRYDCTVRLWPARDPAEWLKRSGGEWSKEFDSYSITTRREKLT